MKRSILVGYEVAGQDEDHLLSTDAQELGASGDEEALNAPLEKVYGLGWFKVDHASSQPAPAPSGGVPNCGVCSYNRTSGTLYSLPPELFKDLAPQTKLTLTLGEGDPGVTFEWNPSETRSLEVQFPREMSPSPLAKWVYLVIPGHDYAIPVPIVREENTTLRRSMNRAPSSSRAAAEVA